MVLLVWPSTRWVEHFAFAHREPGHAPADLLPRQILERLVRQNLRGLLDGGKDVPLHHRLLDEVQRACLHRPHRSRDIAVSRQHDDRQRQSPSALSWATSSMPLMPGQAQVDQQAGWLRPVEIGPGMLPRLVRPRLHACGRREAARKELRTEGSSSTTWMRMGRAVMAWVPRWAARR